MADNNVFDDKTKQILRNTWTNQYEDAYIINIIGLIVTFLSLLVQFSLIYGLYKNIRPLLIVWIVVESITALLTFIGTIVLAVQYWLVGKPLMAID